MDINAPITSIMSVDILTVEPGDKLVKVKKIFETNHIHHVPVVADDELVGIIAQSDLKHFYRGMQKSDYDKMLENSRLNNYSAEDIMTTGLSTKLPPGSLFGPVSHGNARRHPSSNDVAVEGDSPPG